jgi:hypothetical protein
MSKKKIVDKLEKMKKTAQRLIVENPCDKLDEIQNDISNGYITAIDEVNEFIQSEPEEKPKSLFFECPICHTQAGLDLAHQEKTNFDVITESKGKLANYIYKIIDCKKCPLQIRCSVKNEFVCYSKWYEYLNQKAGE